ncbi:hypothetical protein Q664_17250 [Archangium violaceum Cb vi76]|uniref:HEPN AbiU2-like domain-containing protein n=1 Tax=Archangium violaceum Cb vi76 TaxID=1406225 RepID=A0A084SUD0_9BACT|nr:hypothetical protein Q664_17250 [Archangium violaceum Cb vi76]
MLAQHQEGKSSQNVGIKNDAVYQLVCDSFDMLVIDLLSVRQALIKDGGLLCLLKKNPDRLRRCEASEIETVGVHIGSLVDVEDLERFVAEAEDRQRKQIAQKINSALELLVPSGESGTKEGVEALIKRFIKETEPLERDRNRFRAHRYEQNFNKQSFQPLSTLKAQLDAFERLLGALHIVLERPIDDFVDEDGESLLFEERMFVADIQGTAEDLADIIVNGRTSKQ